MKYIDAEKLIAEIRKLRSESYISESEDYYEYAKSDIIDIIDSLQQEQKCHGCFNRDEVFMRGMKYAKEQMMKDAVECELYWDGDFLSIDLNMAALGYSERDKVKVIVLKDNGDESK